jgi:hypothetical protein
VKCPRQVDPDHPGPLVVLEPGRDLEFLGSHGVDAGDVRPDVQSSELGDGCIGGRLDLGRVAHIDPVVDGPAAAGREVGGCLRPERIVDIGDEDVGAGLCQTAGDPESNSLGAARDDGDAALEGDQLADGERVEVLGLYACMIA